MTTDTPEAAKPKLTRDSYDENWNMKSDTPRTDAYYAGKGCECSAHNRSECGCDVDWTDPRIYALKAEVERLKDSLNDCLGFLSLHGAVGATPDTARLLQNRIKASLNPTNK